MDMIFYNCVTPIVAVTIIIMGMICLYLLCEHVIFPFLDDVDEALKK